jgi:hypothetical protein
MQISIPKLEPDYLVYAGAIGIFLGLVSFIFFFYRRIRWIIEVLSKKHGTSIGLLASLRNLLLITVWIGLFGMVFFFGFFLRAYHVFNNEEPVAEIIVRPLENAAISKMGLAHFFSTHSQKTRYLFIKGDQWMIEGDIIKWSNWLNFLGMHTRYRLTRLRGRYLNISAEIHQPHTIHSLVEQEDNPLWRYLYKYGPQLPFVSTVYGNAVFQNTENYKHYSIYVGTSGFIVREK